MTIKLFAAAVVALSAFATQAEAAQTWTVTTTGYIGGGIDRTGVFGTAGAVLDGLAFTQSITANIDPALWQFSNTTTIQAVAVGSGPGFSDTVTVNGHSFTFNALSTTYGTQIIQSGYTAGLAYAAEHGVPPQVHLDDWIQSSQYGKTAKGYTLTANTQVYSGTTAFVPTPSFTQSISPLIIDHSFSAATYFDIYGAATSATFSGVATTVSVNVLAVPEPETYAMLLVGLGLVGLVARRKHIAV